MVQGRHVSVGNHALNVCVGSRDEFHSAENVKRFADEGKTPVYVAIDGLVAALVAMADPLKSSSPEVVARLQRLGYQVTMLTGDHERTAHAVARIAGITESGGGHATPREGRRNHAAPVGWRNRGHGG